MPTPFRLADEFTDPAAEQALLAALARDPARYWELVDLLPPGAFTAEAAVWEELAAAVEAERPPAVPADWTQAPDPEAVAQRLADLHQRRMLAEAQERLAQALLDESRPAQELAALLQEEAARVQAVVRELRAGRLLWASELVAQMVQEAEERRRQREETGRAVTGVPAGLPKLDQLLNGLGTGLFVLAGAPGAGKTTLSLQLALQAARDGVPAVYVTYENSPSNLVQKAICARAGIPSSDVERGFGDPVRLRQAAAELHPVLGRLAIIEGTSRLTVPQVRAKALQALNRTKAGRCLVVFDYLQRAAHGQGYDQLRHNVMLLALGGYNLLHRGRGRFRLAVLLELVLIAGIFVAAGRLSTLPPAATELALRSGPFQEEAEAGGLRLRLRIEPNRVGTNRPTVTLSRSDGSPEGGAAVSLRATMAGHDMGVQTLETRERAPGVYEAEPVVFGMDGEWQVEVSVLTAGGREIRTAFRVMVPPPAAVPPPSAVPPPAAG